MRYLTDEYLGAWEDGRRQTDNAQIWALAEIAVQLDRIATAIENLTGTIDGDAGALPILLKQGMRDILHVYEETP